MSAAAILSLAYPRNTDKRAARDFGVSVPAIRWWKRYGFPKGREEQIQRVLSERIEENIAEALDTLTLIRGEFGNAKGSALGGVASGRDRAGVPARRPVDREEAPP